MVSKGFENLEIVIGTVKANKNIKGEFVYNGPKDDIDRITKSCGSCTTLHDMKQTKGVTYIPFTYKDPHVSNKGTKEKYPSGVINVSKNITVWFKDGRDKKVKSNSGSLVSNPQKEHQVLTYRVDVLL